MSVIVNVHFSAFCHRLFDKVTKIPKSLTQKKGRFSRQVFTRGWKANISLICDLISAKTNSFYMGLSCAFLSQQKQDYRLALLSRVLVEECIIGGLSYYIMYVPVSEAPENTPLKIISALQAIVERCTQSITSASS